VAGTQLVNISTGKWTTRGYANSRIANSRPSQLAHWTVADWTARGLVKSQSIQLVDWSTCGCQHQQ